MLLATVAEFAVSVSRLALLSLIPLISRNSTEVLLEGGRLSSVSKVTAVVVTYTSSLPASRPVL